MDKKTKNIIMIIILLVILAGVIMLFAVKFNKSLEYRSGTRIEVSLPKGYDKGDIEEIAKVSFTDKKFIVQDIEKLNQVVSIKLQSYTEEEFNNFKSKISEKYEIDEEKLSIFEIEVPATRIRTVISPYVFPVSLITILSLVYIGIRNIKNGKLINKISKILTTLILVAGLFFSIILITRIPFSKYTMPIALMVYLVTLLISITLSNKEKLEN